MNPGLRWNRRPICSCVSPRSRKARTRVSIARGERRIAGPERGTLIQPTIRSTCSGLRPMRLAISSRARPSLRILRIRRSIGLRWLFMLRHRLLSISHYSLREDCADDCPIEASRMHCAPDRSRVLRPMLRIACARGPIGANEHLDSFLCHVVGCARAAAQSRPVRRANGAAWQPTRPGKGRAQNPCLSGQSGRRASTLDRDAASAALWKGGARCLCSPLPRLPYMGATPADRHQSRSRPR
jgi:hypothetical protein